jgi:hypothetical protein
MLTLAFACSAAPSFTSLRKSSHRGEIVARRRKGAAFRSVALQRCVHSVMSANEAQKSQFNATGPTYVSPLSTRYASAAMRETFSDVYRFRLWRKLWYVLADCERSLGLQITSEQVEALRKAAEDDFPIPLEAAAAYEAKLRHDVMAHVHALGDQVPVARPIICSTASTSVCGSSIDSSQSEWVSQRASLSPVRRILANRTFSSWQF